MLLHNLQELDNDLRARANEHLALAGLLGVVDGVQRIVEDGSLDHIGGIELGFSRRVAARGICRLVVMSAFRSHVERKECPSGARGAVKGSSAHVEAGAAVSPLAMNSECWPWLPEGRLFHRCEHTSKGVSGLVVDVDGGSSCSWSR